MGGSSWKNRAVLKLIVLQNKPPNKMVSISSVLFYENSSQISYSMMELSNRKTHCFGRQTIADFKLTST